MEEISQEERQAALEISEEVNELFKQYKAILNSQRERRLPLSQEAQRRIEDQLSELSKKAWRYGVDLHKYL